LVFSFCSLRSLRDIFGHVFKSHSHLFPDRLTLFMGSILTVLSYSEFVRLVISLSIDVVEYIVPVLMLPLIGDLFDIVGVATSIYLFREAGLLTLLELVPGLDFLPMNTIAWFVWLILKRQREAIEGLVGKEF